VSNIPYPTVVESQYQTPVTTRDELYAANIAARLPILAIMGAEEQLPRVTREEGASEKPFITTCLEVKWERAIGVLAGILVGQLIAIGVVFYASKGVAVRHHDSFFSVARLLRTAMGTVKGRSADTGEQVADSIQETAGGIRYGMRTVCDDVSGRQWREVDLWNDVKIFLRTGSMIECIGQIGGDESIFMLRRQFLE